MGEMKIKTLIIAILSVAGLLFAVSFGLGWAGGQDPEKTPMSGPATEALISSAQSVDQSKKSSTGDQSSSSSAPKSQSAAQHDKTTQPSEPKATATRPTWVPQPSESEDRLEMPEKPKKSVNALPSSTPRAAVLEKAPKAGAENGKLTRGFPKHALPLPPSADVVKSSVDLQSKMAILDVQARSKQSVEQVVDFYESHFKNLQWLATESKPGKGTTQLRAEFGQDTATITVHQLPTGLTEVNAAGVFRVGG